MSNLRLQLLACKMKFYNPLFPFPPDITLANDARKSLTITPKKPRCCWRVDKHDLDCKVGILSSHLLDSSDVTFLAFVYKHN